MAVVLLILFLNNKITNKNPCLFLDNNFLSIYFFFYFKIKNEFRQRPQRF